LKGLLGREGGTGWGQKNIAPQSTDKGNTKPLRGWHRGKTIQSRCSTRRKLEKEQRNREGDFPPHSEFTIRETGTPGNRVSPLRKRSSIVRMFWVNIENTENAIEKGKGEKMWVHARAFGVKAAAGKQHVGTHKKGNTAKKEKRNWNLNLTQDRPKRNWKSPLTWT